MQGDNQDQNRDKTQTERPDALTGQTPITTIHERLIVILKKLYEIYGGWKQLGSAMEAAGYPVRRQKLSQIHDGENRKISLTMVELQNINSVLHKLNMPGLESLFRTPSLPAAITQIGTIHFWLGFKPEPATEGQDAQTWISQWDLESVNALTQGFYPVASGKLEVVIDKVLLEQQGASQKSWPTHLRGCGWHATLREQGRRHSLIAVGSPKSCHATECLLAEMFRVNEFEPNARLNELPFRFEFSPGLLEARPSAFAYAAEMPNDPESPSSRTDTYALVFDGVRYEKGLVGEQWNDYGVIVSQRRKGGQVWTVVAGLSGPATFAAAKMVAEIEHDFGDQVGSDGNSRVLCHAVRAYVERDRETIVAGDDRVVYKSELVGEPIIWPRPRRVVAPPAPEEPATKRRRKPR
jgi:hypothetical protein